MRRPHEKNMEEKQMARPESRENQPEGERAVPAFLEEERDGDQL